MKTITLQFLTECSKTYHAAGGGGDPHFPSRLFVDAALQVEGSTDICLPFHLSIAHGANEGDAVRCQVVTEEAIEGISVSILHQHMDNCNRVNEVKLFV